MPKNSPSTALLNSRGLTSNRQPYPGKGLEKKNELTHEEKVALYIEEIRQALVGKHSQALETFQEMFGQLSKGEVKMLIDDSIIKTKVLETYRGEELPLVIHPQQRLFITEHKEIGRDEQVLEITDQTHPPVDKQESALCAIIQNERRALLLHILADWNNFGLKKRVDYGLVRVLSTKTQNRLVIEGDDEYPNGLFINFNPKYDPLLPSIGPEKVRDELSRSYFEAGGKGKGFAQRIKCSRKRKELYNRFRSARANALNPR